jgi:hypothetical protein
MSALAKPEPIEQPDLLDVLTLRCEARALMVSLGAMTLLDAVDGCQQAAEAYGLVINLGQDAVQAIIAEAFARRRDA